MATLIHLPLTQQERLDLEAVLRSQINLLDESIEHSRFRRSRALEFDPNACGLTAIRVIETLERYEDEHKRLSALLERLEYGI